jgi:predicted permease
LAIVLLAVGGLFMRSLAQLQNVDAGFVSRGVLLGWIAPPRTTVPGGGTNTSSRSALFLQIWQNLRGRPDVSAAALASAPPFTDSKDAGSFEIEGRPSRAGDVGPHGSDRRVSPDYFAALRIPLKQGRSFTEQDVATGELVAVIDENLAREYWPGESPLGKRMRKIDDEWFRVVGVVGHVLDSDLATDSGKGTYYFSLFQRTAPNVAVMVRTNGDVTRISSVIREAVQSANPRLPVQMQSMEELVARSLAVRRFGTQLVGFFAAVGLFLSALGLYGVISYQVSQRRREIGVRMALGAARSSILQMVVGQGVRMACVGIGLGLIAAAVASRGLESVLYAVSPFDPITMLGVAGVVLATAVLASWLPAYRAVRIDPAVAVRPE